MQTQCEAGKYTAIEGQSTCLPAEPGEYVPGRRLVGKDPEKCKPGETPKPEASSCDPCPSGSYAATRPRGAARLLRATVKEP